VSCIIKIYDIADNVVDELEKRCYKKADKLLLAIANTALIATLSSIIWGVVMYFTAGESFLAYSLLIVFAILFAFGSMYAISADKLLVDKYEFRQFVRKYLREMNELEARLMFLEAATEEIESRSIDVQSDGEKPPVVIAKHLKDSVIVKRLFMYAEGMGKVIDWYWFVRSYDDIFSWKKPSATWVFPRMFTIYYIPELGYVYRFRRDWMVVLPEKDYTIEEVRELLKPLHKFREIYPLVRKYGSFEPQDIARAMLE